MTISELASEIRCEKQPKINKTEEECFYKKLTDTINKFNKDFKCVIPELISCKVKYEPCFLYKKTETDFHNFYLFPKDKQHEGSVCICNSILFTYDINGKENVRQKRIFYNEDGWFYIARQGQLMNANIYLKDHRTDLIIFLDGVFEGEYK